MPSESGTEEYEGPVDLNRQTLSQGAKDLVERKEEEAQMQKASFRRHHWGRTDEGVQSGGKIRLPSRHSTTLTTEVGHMTVEERALQSDNTREGQR